MTTDAPMNRTALLCLLLAGCAAPVPPRPFTGWTHASADAAQFRQDSDACVYEAKKAVAGYGSGYVPPTPEGAMSERYRQLDRTYREIGVFDACMRVRGYYERGER